MPLFTNQALIENPALRRWPNDDRAWRTFIQQLNSQSITASSMPLGAQGWATTTAFSATDADTVAWGAGTLTTASGTAYSIGSGDTGNMVARTYVFFDADVSTTAYQITTTAGDSVGGNRILVAVCENTSDEAFFQVFGGIGGVLVTANEIAANTITANEIAATLSWVNSLVVGTGGEIRQGQTAYDTGTGFWLGDDSGTPKFSIGNSAGNKLSWDGSTLIVEGTVGGTLDATDLDGSPALNIADQGWIYDAAFSSTDADTVAWATGTLTTADGTTYSITGSDTGNMVARTYIYLDIGVSTTLFQTSTTASDSVGSGRILVAVAQNVVGQAAFFHVFGGYGGSLFTSNEIATNAITANAIVAGAVTAGKISVTDLAAINADMGAINAGSIDLTEYIAAGQSAYDTGTGFYIEYNGGTPRFSIGNAAANKMTWDGSTLSVVGTVSGTLTAADLSGTVTLSATNIAAQGWTTTTVFSSTDADTVAWAAGTLTTAAGTAYSISGSNTGNMVARTYIYLDIGVSTTAFQTTTTAATAIGSGKILVAVAEDTTTEAFFQVFGGYGGTLLTANEIAANTITGNNIAANAIDVSELAASITYTKELVLSGAGKIRRGKTSASSTTQGFWLGDDGASGNDFHIGDDTEYMWWDDSEGRLKIQSLWLPQTKVKSADENDQTTTPQNDDHIASISLLAATRYAIDGYLTVAHPTDVADMIVLLSFTQTPADTGEWSYFLTDVAGLVNADRTAGVTSNLNLNLSVRSDDQAVHLRGWFESNATTGGTVTLQWSKLSSPGSNPVYMRKGSWMTFTPQPV